VERCKALFFDERRLACSRCHTVQADPRASKVGPSLFAAGDKFGRRDLVDAILQPSASIAVGYGTTTIRLRSGEILQGVVRESTDAGIALMQTDGTVARVVPSDVARQQTSDLSLMPEGLQNGLTL